MKVEQKKWIKGIGWKTISGTALKEEATLLLAFGDRFLIENAKRYEELKAFYPSAHIVLLSTSGNILGTNVDDDSIVMVAIAFEKSKISVERINIGEVDSDFAAGELIGSHLEKNGLRHVFLFADGHLINGSNLVEGLLKALPTSICVTGGLAGDAARFEETLVGVDAPPKTGEIVAIGFYGEHLQFGFGSMGGWDPFGIERRITRSKNNVLYELDGKCALDLYKEYLGDLAQDLPGAALLFPLVIRKDDQSPPLVRTILGIDEKNKNMVFAGNLPEGYRAQLMKANFDRLIDGAGDAARSSREIFGEKAPDLAILISCVGRRLVLDQRIEEETEAVQDVLGDKVPMVGFYSYGEIAPIKFHSSCELHNQTMTITTISER